MKYLIAISLFLLVSFCYGKPAEKWTPDEQCSSYEDELVGKVSGLKFYRPWMYHMASGRCDTIPTNMYFEGRDGEKVLLRGFALQGVKEHFDSYGQRIITEIITNVGAAGRAAQYFTYKDNNWIYLGYVYTDFSMRIEYGSNEVFLIGTGSDSVYSEKHIGYCVKHMEYVHKLDQVSIVEVESRVIKESCN